MIIQDRPVFVSVAEAARILGISKSTVKRRVAAGTLEAEQLQRAQGVEYRVRVQRDVPGTTHERSDSEPVAPSTGTMQDVSAAITAAVAPLVERLAVQDATIERQAGALRELEHENGRLSAEVAALSSAQNRALEAPTAPQTVERPWYAAAAGWRVLAPWLLAVLAIVAVVVGLVAPR